MKKTRRFMMTAALLAAGGMMLAAACSSGPGSPTGPSGIGTGKAIYQDTATDETAAGIPNAPVYVDGAPALEGGNPVFTDGDGNFQVTLAPGATDPVVYLVEVRDPSDVEVVLWSRLVTVAPDDTVVSAEEPEEEADEETSNGIGPCVSACTQLYKPSSGVDRSLLLPLMEGNKDGKFNAKPCVAFCKENYRGSFPGDRSCNPFYLNYDEATEECTDPEPVEPLAGEPPDEEPPPEEPPAEE
jgi:hypothetical protein